MANDLVGQPILAAAAFQAARWINVGQTLSSVNPAALLGNANG
ncbi:MAG: hypothetical protein ABSG03_02505 [Bryobacteraceae bacterium]|jgi:hypothetical protein